MPKVSLAEIFLNFLKLGASSFGGPIAHVALMDRQLVEKKTWLNRTEFLELQALTSLIPGPNSTELAMAIGRKVGGVSGQFVAALGFITPAFLSSTILAAIYLQSGQLAIGQQALVAMRPVILVIILMALFRFALNLPRKPLLLIGGTALALRQLGWHELLIIVLGGFIYLLSQRRHSYRSLVFLWPFGPELWQKTPGTELLWTFFKIGSVIYGSGYTLLLYLEADLVHRLGWLNKAQLLDAITIGQITPGPLFSSASFIGFLVQGWSGALLASLGIFAPGFLLVGFGWRFLPKLQKKSAWKDFLLGVNLASMGLMILVTQQLAAACLTDWQGLVIAVLSIILLVKTRIEPSLILLMALAFGLYTHFF